MVQDQGASADADRAGGPADLSPQAVSTEGAHPSRLEFRPDYKGRFDEIVARFADGMVHVETMSDQSCYVGFYWDDGRYCQWWISSSKKLSYQHADGKSEPPRFTAWGVDRRDGSGEAGETALAGSTRRATARAEGIARPLSDTPGEQSG